MKLSNLIQPLVLKQASGDLNTEISGLQMDSRAVRPGDLFVAIAGFTVDGHAFVDQALENGASAILVEQHVDREIPTIVVPDSKRAMALIAARFFNYPTQTLRVIGVTGTNGKTTTSHLIQQVLSDANRSTGLIGTVGMKINNETYPVANTTPEIIDLQKGFRMMVDQGLEHAVIEVSSHALDLGRTRGIEFRTAVFTNLTQDHLDYHETMDKYRDAKGLLFSQLGNHYAATQNQCQTAILNADDPASAHYKRITPAQVVTYGVKEAADVRAENIRVHSQGTTFQLHTFAGSTEIKLQLIGMFNVYNAIAATATALVEGIALSDIKASLEKMTGVDGRFQWVQSDAPYTVLVDYAHTPDSLENALTTTREFAEGRVICVVGCGGDRDRSKRPIMAKIAETYSDYTVITSDNPRTEQPEKIIDEMIQGLTKSDFTVYVDRKQAIEHAILAAEPGDVVLIAGKGHETYQEINGVKHDFDDREVARAAMVQKERDFV